MKKILIKFLNISKNDLKDGFTPLFKNIVYNCDFNLSIIKENSYIFNWKGKSRIEDLHTRKMELVYAEKLFSLNNIHQFILFYSIGADARFMNVVYKMKNKVKL